MRALLIMVGLECALAAVAFVVMHRRADGTALGLLAWSAPLELYRTDVAGFSLSLFRLSIVVAAGVFLVEWRRGSGKGLRCQARFIRRPLFLVYAFIACFIALSLAIHPINLDYGGRLLGIVGVGAMGALAVAVLAARFPLETTARAVAFGAVLPIGAVCWQTLGARLGWDPMLPFLGDLPVPAGLAEKSRDATGALGTLGDRAKGTFADPNHLGAYLAMTLSISVGLLALAAMRSSLKGFVEASALIVAIGCGLLLSFSRSAWLAGTLGLAASIVMLLPALRRLSNRRQLLIGAGTLGCLALLAAAPVASKALRRLDPGEPTNAISNETHSETVRFAVARFTDHPIDGVGVGGLGVLLNQTPGTSGAHSTYATVAAELGIFGLVALLVAIALAIASLERCRRRVGESPVAAIPATFVAAYAAFAITNLIYDLWWDDFHWLLLGIALAFEPQGLAPSRFPRSLRRLARRAKRVRSQHLGAWRPRRRVTGRADRLPTL